MILSKDEILKGKSSVIKQKEYLSTKDYIQPFLDKTKDIAESYHFEAIAPDQVTKDDNSVDITYNRVLVYAILKNDSVYKYKQVIGLSYTLDGRQPIYKLFRGYVEDNTNKLFVFDPNWIIVNEIEPEEKLYIDIDNLLKLDNKFKEYIDELKSTQVNRSSMSSTVGHWVDKCLKSSYDNGYHNVKLSTKDFVDLYNCMFVSSKSSKYIPKDKTVCLFDLYNEMIEVITSDEKDIVNRFEKTILLRKIFND